MYLINKLIVSSLLLCLVALYIINFDILEDQPIASLKEQRAKIITVKERQYLSNLAKFPNNTGLWLDLSDLYLYNNKIAEALTALNAASQTVIDDKQLIKLIDVKIRHVQAHK